MTLCKRKGQHQSHAIDNVFLSLRNCRLDKADKQEQRQAEISYRYSKEVQGVLMAIERFKRQHCQDSDELYYQRLRMMDLEEDWELRCCMALA